MRTKNSAVATCFYLVTYIVVEYSYLRNSPTSLDLGLPTMNYELGKRCVISKIGYGKIRQEGLIKIISTIEKRSFSKYEIYTMIIELYILHKRESQYLILIGNFIYITFFLPYFLLLQNITY